MQGVEGLFSVNINPKTIEDPRFPNQLSSLLADAGVSDEVLEIEILEISSIKDFERLHGILQPCKG